MFAKVRFLLFLFPYTFFPTTMYVHVFFFFLSAVIRAVIARE